MPLRSDDVPARRAVLPATLVALVALAVIRWLLADGAAGLALDVVLALAAAAGTIEAARRARPGRSRLGWYCSAAAVLAWLLAPLAWLAGLPEAVATAGRLGLVLMSGAAWWFTSRGPDTWSRVRLVVDGALAGASVFVVLWQPVLLAVFEQEGGGVPGALAVGVPLAALAVATLANGVAMTEMSRDRRGMPRVYSGGLVLIAVSDVLAARGQVPVWAVGFALIAVATRVYRGTSRRRTPTGSEPQVVYTAYLLLAPALVTVVARHLSGGIRPAEATVAVIMGALLVVRQHVTLTENHHLVQQLAATERRLRHQAMHDSLTGLGGRAMLHDRLGAAVRRHRDHGLPIAVVFIDLDDFKQVNDTYGHAAGDDVLVAIARRLARALEPLAGDAIAFRMSGDEFAVLLSGDAAQHAARTAHELLATISAPVPVGDEAVVVGGSVGVAVPGPDVPAEPSALLRAADVAMYGVKHAGKGGVAEATG